MLYLTFPTLLLKNLQKAKNCCFQRLTGFVVELEVVSKPFSKRFPRTKFWFKHVWTLCLTFPENGFNFATQKFAENKKINFQTFTTFSFDLKVLSKPFSKIPPMNNFEFKKFWFVTFPKKRFQLGHWKIGKILKNLILKRSGDPIASKVSF